MMIGSAGALEKGPMDFFQNTARTIVCLLFFSGCLSACGYTTKSTLPRSIKTIHIEPFKNSIDFSAENKRNIYLPLLEVNARQAVVDRFLYDGTLKIADQDQADLVLKAELLNYERSGLRYTDNDDVQEYRVHVTVALELWGREGTAPNWTEPSFVGEATYYVTGPNATSEESAVEEALSDLARRIVERTVEDW